MPCASLVYRRICDSRGSATEEAIVSRTMNVICAVISMLVHCCYLRILARMKHLSDVDFDFDVFRITRLSALMATGESVGSLSHFACAMIGLLFYVNRKIGSMLWSE